MNNFPYKGDWRVKEYKPYVEMLEAEYAKLEERIIALFYTGEKVERAPFPSPLNGYYAWPDDPR